MWVAAGDRHWGPTRHLQCQVCRRTSSALRCSAGLTPELENWPQSLINAAPPAPFASVTSMPLVPNQSGSCCPEMLVVPLGFCGARCDGCCQEGDRRQRRVYGLRR